LASLKAQLSLRKKCSRRSFFEWSTLASASSMFFAEALGLSQSQYPLQCIILPEIFKSLIACPIIPSPFFLASLQKTDTLQRENVFLELRETDVRVLHKGVRSRPTFRVLQHHRNYVKVRTIFPQLRQTCLRQHTIPIYKSSISTKIRFMTHYYTKQSPV